MAKNKKSFIAYSDWKDTFNALPDDKAGQLIKHLFAYVNDESPKTDDILINAVFANIKQTLKRDLRKYETIREKRSLAGKASANKKQQVLTSVDKRQQTSTKSTVSVNDNVNDNVNVIVSKKEKRFTPPVISDVVSYFEENGYKRESGIKAYNYYNTANWKDSKGNQVRNWKQKMIAVWFKDENKINNTNSKKEYHASDF
jgi:hypothetical protein